MPLTRPIAVVFMLVLCFFGIGAAFGQVPPGSGFTGKGGLATAYAVRSPRSQTAVAGNTVYFGVRKTTPVSTPAFATTGAAFDALAGKISGAVMSTRANSIGAPLPLPPVITYKTPQVFALNTAIVAIAPINTGGAVPANAYGMVSTFAGNGTAASVNGTGTAAAFNSPTGLAMDADGNIIVSDYGNNQVRKISAGGVVTTIAGTVAAGYNDGAAASAKFSYPVGVAVDAANNIYVSDFFNFVIRKITPDGTVSTFSGSGMQGESDGAASVARFDHPGPMVMDKAGNLYVMDTNPGRLRKIAPDGGVTTIAGSATRGAADGNGPAASFNGPLGLTIDDGDNLYVADTQNGSIRKVTPAGVVTTVFLNLGAIQGIAIDPLNNLYVANATDVQAIKKITPGGVVTILAGGGADSEDGFGQAAGFDGPVALLIDKNSNLLIAETENNDIRQLALTGYTIDRALPAGLSFDYTTGIISGTPTALATAADYLVTAYNLAGSSTTTADIAVQDIHITLPPITAKNACDADFDPGATGNSAFTYTSSNTAVATIVGGKVHIVGAGTSAIKATASSVSATQTLTVNAAPALSVSIAASYTTDACKGQPVTFVATPINGGPNPVYQWQVNGQNEGTNNRQFTTSTVSNNDKVTCILTSDAACSASVTSNQVAVVLAKPATPVISITSSATGPFCAGTPVMFKATSSVDLGGVVYQWQVNGRDKGDNSPTFTTNTLTAGDMVVCLVSGNAKCLVISNTPSNTIIATLDTQGGCEIVIPKAFTPNGDGTNDQWNINALLAYPHCTVYTYNRAGRPVFTSVGYSKAWDGTMNGQRLAQGTYYYIIDLKNGRKPFIGYVEILQ